MTCPCGSGKPLSACCGPYLEGKEDPPTPEALMRSRYTAYTQGNLDYIEKTMKGNTLITWDVLWSPLSQNTNSKSVCLHKLDEMLTSEKKLAVCPRAFDREVPGNDLKRICQDSTDVEEF